MEYQSDESNESPTPCNSSLNAPHFSPVFHRDINGSSQKLITSDRRPPEYSSSQRSINHTSSTGACPAPTPSSSSRRHVSSGVSAGIGNIPSKDQDYIFVDVNDETPGMDSEYNLDKKIRCCGYADIQYLIFTIITDRDNHAWPARYFDYCMMFVIIVNSCIVILHSDPDISGDGVMFYESIEISTVVVFTVEYALRIWTCSKNPNNKYRGCRGKLRWMLLPLSVIDLIAILAFYLSFITEEFQFDLKILSIIRIISLLKIERQIRAFHTFTSVVKRKLPEVIMSFFLVFIAMVLLSSIVFAFERDAQPEDFRTIPKSLWWGAITMTTVGYGDVVPITSTLEC